MSVTLTVGTDSYTTLAAFKVWLANRLDGATPLALSDDTLSQALLQACAAIEALDPAGWPGYPYISTQALAWPRSSVVNRLSGGDNTYDATTYPAPLVTAQYEEALELLKENADPGAAPVQRDRAKGIVELEIGQSRVKYQHRQYYGGSIHSEAAWRLIKVLRRKHPGDDYNPYLDGQGQVIAFSEQDNVSLV